MMGFFVDMLLVFFSIVILWKSSDAGSKSATDKCRYYRNGWSLRSLCRSRENNLIIDCTNQTEAKLLGCVSARFGRNYPEGYNHAEKTCCGNTTHATTYTCRVPDECVSVTFLIQNNNEESSTDVTPSHMMLSSSTSFLKTHVTEKNKQDISNESTTTLANTKDDKSQSSSLSFSTGLAVGILVAFIGTGILFAIVVLNYRKKTRLEARGSATGTSTLNRYTSGPHGDEEYESLQRPFKESGSKRFNQETNSTYAQIGDTGSSATHGSPARMHSESISTTYEEIPALHVYADPNESICDTDHKGDDISIDLAPCGIQDCEDSLLQPAGEDTEQIYFVLDTDG